MFDNSSDDKRIQLLKSIVSQNTISIDDQLNFALEKTCKLLDLDIGIISNIEDDVYTIKYYYPKDVDLNIGQKFELGNTYCSIALSRNDIFSVSHMAESEYKYHPCYNAFHLESYIGVQFHVNGTPYGTINFSSSEPKKEGFTKADQDLIVLLGEWAGGIIHRKLMEEQLNKEKELYKLLSHNSAELKCLHKPDGTYSFVSESVYDILGYEPEELVGASPYDLIHDNDIEENALPSHKKVAKGNAIPNIEYRMRRKNGDYIWVDTAAEPVLDNNGNVVAIQTTSRDISDRKRTDFMLNESQKMASVGGWEYELDTGELYWTDEVYRIHDIEIGIKVNVEDGLSFFPNKSLTKIQDAINKAVETGESYDLELEFISKTGVKKWVRAIGYAIMVSGKAQKLRGTFQDITQQVLSNQKIVAQNEELERSKEEKEKIYSIIAHDLRGAFTGIIGFLEVLKSEFKKDISTEQLNMIRIITNSSKNAYELMENLLRWIKYTDNEESIERKSIDLAQVIDECVEFLKPTSSKKNVTVKNTIQNVELSGNEDMLATIFRNLLSNAIKFSRPDSDVLVIGKPISENLVEIKVKDFGIGMSSDIVKDLFNKKIRPTRIGTSKEKGSGLGLILCKELVEIHHGTIDVKSNEGEGSEFILSFKN